MEDSEGLVVLSLFDGMSCGQQALERAGKKIKTYYASEIDKYAIAVTQHNYPNTIQLGSVVDVDGYSLPKVDILLGGSPCFAADTKVITKESIKNIEDVVVGDFVLTHSNEYQKVMRTGNKNSSDIVLLKAQGILETTTTKEHPYYVRTASRIWDNSRRTSVRIFSEPEWKPAIELKKNDFIGIPIIKTESNPLNITHEEAYIIGRYIADGHCRKDYRVSENRKNDRHWQLILSIGEHKLPEFKESINSNNYSCYKHTDSVFRCGFSNKRLVEIVEANCGSGAINKHISMNLLNLPIDILEKMLDGYLSGDGYNGKAGYSITTISKDLIHGLSLAIAKVYRVGSNVTFHKTNPTHVIQGRIVNQNDTYLIRFKKEVTKQANYKVIGDVIWYPIKSVTSVETPSLVYNLEVEIDNSYTANSAIVHNCQSFSFAGKRKGMSTKCETEILTLEHYLQLKSDGFEFEGQSYLFWEFMRLLHEVKPKYFLLENVEMGEKWEKVLSKAIGVNGIHINSALVSAQNRKRIYWTNIGLEPGGLFGDLQSTIKQPKDKGILLKHILETDVDEKYFLSDKMLKFLQAHSDKKQEQGCGFKFAPKIGNEKANTLTQRMAKMGVDDNYINESIISGSVKFGRSDEGKQQRRESMKKGVDHTPFQSKEIIGLDFDKMNTLTTASNKDNLVMQLNGSTESGGKQPYQQNRVYDPNGISPALMAQMSCGTHAILEGARIRRLTPTECCRLQTVREDYFLDSDGKQIISNSQIYKLLGNGWNIDTIVYILSYMK